MPVDLSFTFLAANIKLISNKNIYLTTELTKNSSIAYFMVGTKDNTLNKDKIPKLSVQKSLRLGALPL